ncbi:MAG: thiolase family protein, partial [Bdellovibrionaceae bacterium]|nr:thiolase family protein [Pseudobdellovibrionaceae bacterium]
DEWAKESFRRALSAQKEGQFDAEIVPVPVPQRKGDPVLVKLDEGPAKGDPAKIGTLRAAFSKDGTITAANASSINDGAAAHVLMAESVAKARGVKPLARIVAHGTFAHDPKYFTTAPAGAIRGALKKANLKISDIDLWEINEAFAAVTMVAMKDLEIPAERVNVHGGAIAIGHPIGASGARLLATLVHALHTQNKRYGLATLCIGGGEAVALIVERV